MEREITVDLTQPGVPKREPSLMNTAFTELEEKVRLALETYSNVHRGSGHYSEITTDLFECARNVVLKKLGLDGKRYLLIFCSVYSADLLKSLFNRDDFQVASSADIGIPLGIRAIAVKKTVLPRGVPFQTGGSVARMVSPGYVVWSGAPQRFEAGTPPIINAVAFAVALILTGKYGPDCFRGKGVMQQTIKKSIHIGLHSAGTGLEFLSVLKELLIGKNVCVPSVDGKVPFINFDNAASNPTFEPVWEAVKIAWRTPPSEHASIVSNAKNTVKEFLGADKEGYEVMFHSNTTEAVNVVARLIGDEFRGKQFFILNTILEHNANELPWRYVPGAALIRLPIDDQGIFDMERFEDILWEYNGRPGNEKRIRLVAVNGASNVLGTYNNLEKVCRIAHMYGARVLVDGAQMAAHRRVELEKWGIDYFVLSGHKVYAPFGCGALVMKTETVPADSNLVRRIKETGEENVIGIAAMARSINLLQRIGWDVIEDYERSLTERMLKGLSNIKGVNVCGIKDPGSPKMTDKGGIISFYFKNGRHQPVAGALSVRGAIGLRYGCFCSHMLVKRILGVTPALALLQNIIFTIAPKLSELVPGLMRVSFGLYNEPAEVDRFISVLRNIVDQAPSPEMKKKEAEARKIIREYRSVRIREIFGSDFWVGPV